MKLSVRDAAKIRGVSEQTLRYHVKKGWLKHYLIKGRIKIRSKDLENYIPEGGWPKSRDGEAWRKYDCQSYSACLDAGARKNREIDCEKCNNYRSDVDYLRCF